MNATLITLLTFCIALAIGEKEIIRSEKDSLAIQLSKKEVDFENLWERNKEQKQEVEKLQEKFTKEFENLANKILEEKTNKFTEQNKENMKNILSPLQDKIQLFEKKWKTPTKKASIIMRLCASKF
jgi:DNA recombination protein RmuC